MFDRVRSDENFKNDKTEARWWEVADHCYKLFPFTMSSRTSLSLLPDNVLKSIALHFGPSCTFSRLLTVMYTSRVLRGNFAILLRKFVARHPRKYVAYVTTRYGDDAIRFLKKYKNEIGFWTRKDGQMWPRDPVRAEILVGVSIGSRNAKLTEWLLAEMPPREMFLHSIAKLFDVGDRELIAPFKKYYQDHPLSLSLLAPVQGGLMVSIANMTPHNRFDSAVALLGRYVKNERALELVCDFLDINQKTVITCMNAHFMYSTWCYMLFPVLKSDISIVDVESRYVTLQVEAIDGLSPRLEIRVLISEALPSLVYLASHPRFQPVTHEIAVKLSQSDPKLYLVRFFAEKLREYDKLPASTELQQLGLVDTMHSVCINEFLNGYGQTGMWDSQPKFLQSRYITLTSE